MPTLHTSEVKSYMPPVKRSGAIYAIVPHCVIAKAPVDSSCFEMPKSESLATPRSVIITFAGCARRRHAGAIGELPPCASAPRARARARASRAARACVAWVGRVW